MSTETDDGFVTGTTAPPPGTGEILPEKLDLHSSLPTQVGVIKPPTWRWANPINAIDDTSKTIEFQISSHLNELIDPERTLLYLKCKIVGQNGQDIPEQVNNAPNAAIEVIPVNGLSSALFKNCKVRLNDQPIASGDGMYAYRADFEYRLMWPYSVKKSTLPLAGFDEERHAFEELGNAPVPAFGGYHADQQNPAHKALYRRYKKSKASKEMCFLTRVFSEIFDQSKYLPPDSRVHLAFDRADFDSFTLLANPGDNQRVKITQMCLLVNYVTVDPDVLIEVLKQTEIRPMLYPLRRVEMNYYTKVQGTRDLSTPNLFHEGETLPRRIFIAFVHGDAFRGDYTLDPFNYRDLRITHYALKIGGESIPYPEIRIDNANDNDIVLRVFTLMDATGSLFDIEGGTGIGLANYKKRNNFLCFDLSNSKSPPGETYDLPATKSCDLEITLHDALDDTVTMIVYAEYEAEIEITRNGQVKKKKFGAA